MDIDYVAAFLALDEESNYRRLQERASMQGLRDRSNPFMLADAKFIKLFRMPATAVQQIISVLSAGESPLNNSGSSIPAHLKVLCTLQYYGQGSYQTAVGQDNLLALSQTSVSSAIAMVTDLIIARLTPIIIIFPATSACKALKSAEFQSMFGIPAIGAVDGSHFTIIAPPTNDPVAPGYLFYNRKGRYSINVQLVSDANCKILSINPNYPGSTHDAAVWRASDVHRHLQAKYVEGERGHWLLGDKGYPVLPWLMTPLADAAAGSPSGRYNACHAKARNVVERCFGRLKGKFRCLHQHRTMHYSPTKADKFVVACSTLHNMWLQGTFDDSEDEEETTAGAANDADTEVEEAFDFLQEGRQQRANLVNSYFT